MRLAFGLGAFSLLCGVALVTGTLTPAAAVVSAVLCVARGAVPTAAGDGLANGVALALLGVMGTCVALLGPGAFSVDARLFGRREIVVPRARSSPPPIG